MDEVTVQESTGTETRIVNPAEERQQRISSLAYRKWEEAGKPPSDGVSFWLEAEQEVNEMDGQMATIEQADDIPDD